MRAGLAKVGETAMKSGIRRRLFHLGLPRLSKPAEQADKTTHFGYQTVTEQEKASKVYGVFENVSESYDAMNDAMSFGIHRLWKDRFVTTLAPPVGCRLLDVAGGTGDIAFRFLRYLKNLEKVTASVGPVNAKEIPSEKRGHVTVCDINQSMLEVGQRRAATLGCKEGISWLRGDAMNLPVRDETFDAYTIAFGIRNVVHVEKALAEAYRVLKPGGRFVCLEFSRVPNAGLRWMYDLYSFQVIPVMGKVIANDWGSYQYLVESIRKFPNQDEFANMIKESGFKWVTYENLTFGVVAIHSGFKV